MRIIDLALKDLAQIFRDKRSLLFLVAMPIVFTLFLGFAYQSGSNGSPEDSHILLGWVNQDADGMLSEQLLTLLKNSDAVKLVELEPETASKAVLSGDVAGALVVPQGFSQQTINQPKQLKLITDPTSTAGQSLFQIIRTPITQLFSSVEIAQLSAEIVNKTDSDLELQASFETAAQIWSKTDNTALVKTEMAAAQEEEQWYGDTPYNQSSPGIIVQFAIFGLVTTSQILVQERKTRTLHRMMTTSLKSWQIIAGHLLAMFVVVFIQEALLVVFGQFILGVNYLREPLAVLLIAVTLGLWIAAMGLFIGVLVKDDSQVVLLSMLAMFIFSALGGAWFPLEASSGAFAAIGQLLPSSWAMTGFQNILLRGLGLGSAWTPMLVLFVYATGFFLLAVWRFNKSEL